MRNLTPTRSHSVKSDFGIKDYYKYYKDNGGKLSTIKYSRVLRSIVTNMCNIVIEKDYRYKLPSNMGIIVIEKYKNKTIKDKKGILRVKYPIDFKSTLKLWKDYPELSEGPKKQLVRFNNEHSGGYTFRIRYKTNKANYKNKSLYFIKFNRGFKLRLRDFINRYGNIDKGIMGYE